VAAAFGARAAIGHAVHGAMVPHPPGAAPSSIRRAS
jgi:hypothetical protein